MVLYAVLYSVLIQFAFSAYDWQDCTYFGVQRVSWLACTHFEVPTPIGKNPFGKAQCTGYSRCGMQTGADGSTRLRNYGDKCDIVIGSDGSKVSTYYQGMVITVAYPGGYFGGDVCPGVPIENDDSPSHGIVIKRTAVYDMEGIFSDATYTPIPGSYHCAENCRDADRPMCVFSFQLEDNIHPGRYSLNWQYKLVSSGTSYSNCWKMQIHTKKPQVCIYDAINYGGNSVCYDEDVYAVDFCDGGCNAFDHEVKSIKFSQSGIHTIKLYDDSFTTLLAEYKDDIPTLDTTIENQFSTFYFTPEPEINTACVYLGENYTGGRICFADGDDVDLTLAPYDGSGASGLTWSDSVRSVQFGLRTTAPLIYLKYYQDGALSGSSDSLTMNQPTLSGGPETMSSFQVKN